MKTHKLDAVSLVFGIIFALLGLAFIGFSNPWRAVLLDVNWTWLAPAALLVLGVIVILPLLRRNDDRASHPGTPPADSYDELPPSPLG